MCKRVNVYMRILVHHLLSLGTYIWQDTALIDTGELFILMLSFGA